MNSARTIGESSKTSRLRKKAQVSKSTADKTAKATADLRLNVPLTSAQSFFLGLIRSYLLPSIRFIDIPVALAKLPAPMTRIRTRVPG